MTKAEKRSDKLKKVVAKTIRGRGKEPRHSSGSEEDVLLPASEQERQITNDNATARSLWVIPSKKLPRLKQSEGEGAFMALVSKGNVNGVAAFLRIHPGFNLNCQNYRGHTPLFKAVQNEDEEMVKYLVSRQGILLKDEVLHGIQQGNVAIVELLLSKQTLHVPMTVDSIEFTEDITPLILASHCNNYEMIRLLLEKGHRIKKPHMPTCFCKKQCRGRKKGESLTDSRSRISIYKALAGPCYMALTSSDPILAAFLLSDELIHCATIEKEFKNDYLELSTQCSQFALDLLHQCRKTEEVQTLLECREGSAALGGRQMRFPRIGLALDFGQKNFVAHSNCQQILRTAWLAEWGDWKSLSSAGKLLRVFPRIVLLPFIALVYLLFPFTKLAKSLGSPIKKFLTGTASYVVFLMILATQHELNRKDARRGPPMTGLEFPIIIYLVGFLWLELKQAWILGGRRYINLWWNRYDMIMIFSFAATFSCWLWSYQTIEEEDYYLERKFWNQFDPTLISEGLMAFSTVLAFGRILYILQVHQDLGPLLVSISRMFKDVGIFMAIFAIVLGSFTMGMSSLYEYYNGQRRVDGVGRKIYQISSFVNFQATVKTLFWGVFAMSPSDAADIVIENIGGNSTHPVFNKHKFTEGIGYTLFSLYHIITVIVLLNLLIAMMSDTYQKVQDNADVEWKFARTRVWLSYFEEGGTLPPPFNLIPSPKAILDVFLWIFNVVRADKSVKCSFRRCCHYEDDFDEEQFNESYQNLMTKLIQRYLRSKEEGKKDREVTLSDLEAIRMEIKELTKMNIEVQETLYKTQQTKTKSWSILPDTASNVFLVDPTGE